MRAIIQRVSKASVDSDEGHFDKIGKGLLVFLGVEAEDSSDDIHWLSRKISNLRIFDDANGVMNLSVKDVGGEILIISQFTLHASTRKGNRPSYIKAAKPEYAEKLYKEFLEIVKKESGLNICRGVFGAHMKISLVNDGPVTIMMDTKKPE